MVKAKSHLLKHEVPENVDSVFHFGTDDKKEIARLVAAMGQRQLQEKFKLVYQTNTGSNNNNWLRRKLLEAAGCQEAKVVGMGNTSPRKKGVGMGEFGMDGGASYRTENGMRRTKRPRKPKQNTDYIGEDAFEGGRHRDGGPLSSGDAYLQERTALYKASLVQSGLPGGHDFPFSNTILGKHFTGHNPFSSVPPFHEVQWPGPSQRGGRPDESNSSSEDQTAYEHSHSHHSHQSRDGGPASPRTRLTRNLEESMALLANHATMAPHRQVHMRMQASLPGMAGMAGMPGLAWEDPLSYPFSASAPAKFGGHPGSTSNAYLAQMLRQPSGNHDERVGGNTPLLDLEDPLLDGPMLGHSSANDSFLTGRLPSLEGNLLPSANNSPILGGTDFAALFSDVKGLDMGRTPLLTSQGLGLIDLPTAGHLSSLERLLGDVSPSHLLTDARMHMPAAPPPTPVSHGMTSPRYHAGLEGMAAPSQRFTGAHMIPSALSSQTYSDPALAPRFMQAAAAAAPAPTPASPRAAAPSAAPASLNRQQRSLSMEPPAQRIQLPMLQSMAVRTLSTPEPLPCPQGHAHPEENPSLMHSVPSLGAWNITDLPNLDTPASSPKAPGVPKDLPAGSSPQGQDKSDTAAQLPGTAQQLPEPLPERPALAANKMSAAQLEEAASDAEIAAELLGEPAHMPTIAEEEPVPSQAPAESESLPSQQLTA